MLQENASSRTLALLRITVFGSWFVIVLFFSPSAYSILPVTIFEPWGFQRIFNVFPPVVTEIILSGEFLIILKVLLMAGCLMCMIGVRPFQRYAIATFILIFFLDLVMRGFNGYINHAQSGIYLASLFLVFSPASDAFSVFRHKKVSIKKDYSFAVILTGISLTMAYSFIGINRLYSGGFEIFTNDALVTYIIRNSLNYSMYGFEYGITLISFDYVVILFKAGFFIVTIMEIISPFIFFNRYLRYTWLSVIIPFHFISLFTMNIFFWENILLILVLFIDWDKIKFLPSKH